MVDTKLNLTRKLRAKNFDQVIGQNLSIRILKNSLYLGHYFPVYLFSGQRGCGKTTTARVFSTALNCQHLPLFQKNPKKNILPCGLCDSCNAMLMGTHPDFIEMDAASHTGVDNVRHIIDAASLLPIMGVKKIYLIDEAHMLSKAAFNALLKILEEPPANVVFILATTDPQKIIDTVKSRCFQLLFKAVDEPTLLTHLQHVCATENIPYESAGLSKIIHETKGSVRDALNIVEQVRFSAGTITSNAVLQVLDHLDTDSFIHIMHLIFTNNTRELLLFLKRINIGVFAAEYIWRQFIELIRTMLWLKYGVKPDQHTNYDALEKIAPLCSLAQLNEILHHIYTNEEIFSKTTAQHLFLEMFFLQLSQYPKKGNGGSSVPPHTTHAPLPIMQLESADTENDPYDTEEIDETSQSIQQSPLQDRPVRDAKDTLQAQWLQFINVQEIQQEPLVHSVLSQGVCLHTENMEVIVQFFKELSFFESVIHDAYAIWHPHFERIFAPNTHLVMNFTGTSKTATHTPSTLQKNESLNNTSNTIIPIASPIHKKSDQTNTSRHTEYARPPQKHTRVNTQNNTIDISDSSIWKTTHMVLHHFPGLVREVQQ